MRYHHVAMTEESLTLSAEEVGGVKTVRCAGRLISTNASRLSAEVKPSLRSANRVVLDLTDVAFMDSMGLGTIASLYVSAKTAGCQFEVVNLSRRVRDLFTMTHLLSLFEPCGESNVTM